MRMKNKTLWYLVCHDTIKMLVSTVAMAAIFYYVEIRLEADSPVNFEMLLCEMGLFSVAGDQSFMKYGEYITFGFCRNRFYREQTAVCGIRAAVLSLPCSVVQYLHYDSYVRYFIEDTNKTAALYHRISLGEIFLADMLYFFLINLVLLLLSTLVVDLEWFLPFGHRYRSPQLTYRARIAAEHKRWFRGGWKSVIKLGIWIILIASAVGFISYHNVQMTAGLPVRLGCMAGVAAISVFLYLVGKKRFVPKFI